MYKCGMARNKDGEKAREREGEGEEERKRDLPGKRGVAPFGISII